MIQDYELCNCAGQVIAFFAYATRVILGSYFAGDDDFETCNYNRLDSVVATVMETYCDPRICRTTQRRPH